MRSVLMLRVRLSVESLMHKYCPIVLRRNTRKFLRYLHHVIFYAKAVGFARGVRARWQHSDVDDGIDKSNHANFNCPQLLQNIWRLATEQAARQWIRDDRPLAGFTTLGFLMTLDANMLNTLQQSWLFHLYACAPAIIEIDAAICLIKAKVEEIFAKSCIVAQHAANWVIEKNHAIEAAFPRAHCAHKENTEE